MSSTMRALALGLAALSSAVLPAMAQDTAAWPPGPVKIIVPYAAGATADGLTRILVDPLSQAWKQPVVVENRTGAGGNVGAEVVARAAPDGLTLLHAPTAVYAINPFVYKKLSFDPTALKPITVVAQSPSVMAVSLKLGASSVAEVIAKAKAAPGKLSYASQGSGSTSHITSALFEHRAGIEISHVPYRGSAPAMNDLVGGHVDMLFDNLFSALNQHKAGAIRILAVCTPGRLPALPEVPTMSEAAMPGFQSIAYFAFTAPPGTPDGIVAKIARDIVDILKRPDIRERIEKVGATVVANTPGEMGRMLDSERAMWSKAIRDAKIPQVE